MLRRIFPLAVLLCLLVAGCGSRVRVHGTVTFEDQPADGARIFFLPEGEPVGRATAHATIEGGNYSLPVPKGPELSPGKHRVEIVWHKPPPGKEHRKPGDPGFTTDDYVQILPAAYNSKTTLFVDLQPGDNAHDFALKNNP
jgi:hypothetical protein